MNGRRPWRAAKRNGTISAPHRQPNGQIQRESREETEKERMAVALAQPHRRGYKPRVNAGGSKGRSPAEEPKLGYPLGRMLLSKQITLPQHDALVHWYAVYIKFTKALNLPQVRYGSCLNIDSSGGFEGDDMDPAGSTAKAKRARRSFEELEDAMREGCGVELTAANVALMHVVALDREPASGMIGTLRLVANVIDRYRLIHGPAGID